MDKVKILGVSIDNLLLTELLAQLTQGVVFTPNVDHLVKLQKDKDFIEAYKTADYKLCDSKIICYAASFLGTPVKEKISGSDLFPAFYSYHKENAAIKIFLLGANTGIAKIAKEKINTKVGRKIIIEAHSPSYGFEKKQQECEQIINIINDSGATVLAMGVGSPKQEIWIAKYKEQMPNIKIFLAIGATIDFEAGKIKRCPKWISNLGVEWLYRLLLEPKRLWKRYLVDDLPFLLLVLQQKLNLYRAPTRQEKVDESVVAQKIECVVMAEGDRYPTSITNI